MPKWFRPLLACACFSILVLAGQIAAVRPQKLAAANHPVREGRPQDSGRLEITVSSLGPSQSLIDATTARLPEQDTLRSYLQGARYRLIAFELLPGKGKAEDLRPDSFRALYYDYTNNRTVRAEGSFESISNLEVTVGSDQPVPSAEEYEAAVAILMKDPKLGSSLTQNRLKANPAMPPVIYSDEAAAPVERTINILLLPTAKSEMETEVVGVNMVRNTVVRFPGGAPPTSRANPTACGIPSAGQATTSNGTLGQFQFVVTKNGMEVWRFTAIRPSASSGAVGERSGIDLVNVKFKGKMLLRRMHAPILNVNYDGNVCGPYRDWQWQEGMFQADGTDVPGTNGGVRDCADRPATTALDTDNDFGNFRGIAFYTVGADQLVLVTEMNAGWYRYICEYSFFTNGTIKPRYGYGATNNSCVCAAHTHHVYWRFDFDIGGDGITPAANVVRPSRREFSWGAPYAVETKAYRTARMNWLVQNPNTLDSYVIRPNSNDGSAAQGTFGKGDLWTVVYKSNEINDSPTGTSANIDAFMSSPESLLNQDIVVWYGAHFYHNDGGNSPALFEIGPRVLKGHHVQGPDLMPVRW